MRKSQFTEQQIVAALRQVEGGTAVAEVCRKLGVTEQSFYRWKRKLAGEGFAEFFSVSDKGGGCRRCAAAYGKHQA